MGSGTGMGGREQTTRMSGSALFRDRSGTERGMICRDSLALGKHHLLLRG